MPNPVPAPKRPPSPPVPCVVWLTVGYAAGVDNANRRLFADRLTGFLIRTGIRPIVSTRLIGLHHRAGFVPYELALITAWVSGQPEVQTLDYLQPVPTLLKGVGHG